MKKQRSVDRSVSPLSLEVAGRVSSAPCVSLTAASRAHVRSRSASHVRVLPYCAPDRDVRGVKFHPRGYTSPTAVRILSRLRVPYSGALGSFHVLWHHLSAGEDPRACPLGTGLKSSPEMGLAVRRISTSHFHGLWVQGPPCACARAGPPQSSPVSMRPNRHQHVTFSARCFSPVSLAPEKGSGPTRAVCSPRGTSATLSAAALTSPTSPS